MNKIIKKSDNNYSIQFESYISDFLQQKKLTTNITPKDISFVAYKIEKLNTSHFTSDLNLMKDVIHDLGFQILSLKSENKIIPYLNYDDLILINDTIILFANYEIICNFDTDGYFISNTKYKNYSNFYSPEFMASYNEDKIFYTTIYYSFGIFLLDLFDIIIQDIENTKYYISIKKLLHNDPIKRKFILI